MGLLSFITGESTAANKVIDGVSSGIDMAFFTAEEKAKYAADAGRLHLEILKVTATESTASSISRRMICLPIVYSWIFFMFLYAVVDMSGLEISTVALVANIAALTGVSLAAVAFYVGNHILNKGKQ